MRVAWSRILVAIRRRSALGCPAILSFPPYATPCFLPRRDGSGCRLFRNGEAGYRDDSLRVNLGASRLDVLLAGR
jgi:hypothetical protein